MGIDTQDRAGQGCGVVDDLSKIWVARYGHARPALSKTVQQSIHSTRDPGKSGSPAGQQQKHPKADAGSRTPCSARRIQQAALFFKAAACVIAQRNNAAVCAPVSWLIDEHCLPFPRHAFFGTNGWDDLRVSCSVNNPGFSALDRRSSHPSTTAMHITSSSSPSILE